MRKLAFVLLSFLACQPGDLDYEGAGQGIIGGSEAGDLQYTSVVYLTTADGACTGSLIAPTVVLTAAHCLKSASDNNQHTSGSVRFGNKSPWDHSIQTRRLVPERFYTNGLFSGHDIALVRLLAEAPAEYPILKFNDQPLGDVDGQNVRAVGFGVSDGINQTGAGTKRYVDMPIVSTDDEFVVVGSENQNTCQGDSGGPLFLNINGEETIIGVTAFGEQGCGGPSHKTRVDAYAPWIKQVLAAWDGPCSQDGQCDPMQTCEFPDPDCDVCGFDGVCGQGCPELDLDCPIAGLDGALCDDNDDCESRRCVTAPDDDRVKFCSLDCTDQTDCNDPISSCETVAEGDFCVYDGPSRSAQGATCAKNGDCRSGNCDLEHFICVEPCQAGECSEDYECKEVNSVDSCTIKGGGCQGSGTPFGLVVLLFIGVLAESRRRTRAARQ